MQRSPPPSLAIVIPVFNEAMILPNALKSLQALAVEELIFVDGGSTDDTVQLIQDAGFTCLLSEAGRAKQMNFGTINTTSDIILYLHVDTTVSSSNILNIKKTYNQGFLSGRFDIRLSNDALIYRIISFFINTRSRLSKINTGDQGIFVRREAFEEVGGFPDIPLMEDVAITQQLKSLGKVACLKDKLMTSSRRWENNGAIRTVLLMWKIRFLYWLGIPPEKLVKIYRNAR